jgi:HTH-type transcriptional regulator / antitoxin HipB
MRIRSAIDLGKTIRARRKAKGLTQTELAGLAGVSLRFVSEVERGRGTAGFELVLRLCTRLSMNVTVMPREDA